jgi:hypothetical protein
VGAGEVGADVRAGRVARLAGLARTSSDLTAGTEVSSASASSA